MKMKVLSPAGDMESLKMAIYNGADEVYLGVKDFNARNIQGFSLEELRSATQFAHIYNVRVFLAVNILFDNSEIQSAVDLIVDAYNLGVDAFIIQDVGLASILQKYYPQIEKHASTQMGIHNLEGVRFVEKLGFSRVVLSRETPLCEIKRIRDNSSIEIEYFVQGALCVSFSGNCYMSSYLYDASGNRGKCKQLCRLPYEFIKDGKVVKSGYLLSAKDFNMSKRLKDLQECGVNSLKIEGRARRPYYVAVATKMYRDLVDGIDTNTDIELAFNRGYTEGYFNGNNNIISNRQNHIGIQIGKVEKVNFGKKFNEVFISSDRPISEKSTLKFLDKDSEMVITAFDISQQNGLYRITTTQKVPTQADVHLISDYEKEQLALSKKSKVDISLEISAKVGQNIKCVAKIYNHTIEVAGEVLESAKKAPLSTEDFKTCFNKNEYFNPNIVLDIDNIFMPKSMLNEFRRKVYEKVVDTLTKVDKHLEKIRLPLEILDVDKLINFEVVYDLENQTSQKNVIFRPEIYTLEIVEQFIAKCRKNNQNPMLYLPPFATKQDIEILSDIISKTKITVVANNPYALMFESQIVAGGGLNIYNNFSANYFNLTYTTAENNKTFNMPYMTLRHCPMKEHMNGDCKNCPMNNSYSYKMQNGNTFKLRRTKISSCTFYLED